MSQAKSQLDLDQLSINTIRTLAIDGVQRANSGHPGAPMGLAPVVYELWQRYLRYDPADPLWMNRDRFVLSNGHASMLLYATLHLTGVRDVDGDGNVRPDKPAISLDDLKSFRQLDSKTPGHPESHITAGVETTTGPLGQGVGNSVGWNAPRVRRQVVPLRRHGRPRAGRCVPSRAIRRWPRRWGASPRRSSPHGATRSPLRP